MSHPTDTREDRSGAPWPDVDPEHVGEPAADSELIMYLEPDQLVAETFRPVAPARLGRRAVIGLWALRIFVILVSLMVIYTFFARLR
jgi:hypothetical protein